MRCAASCVASGGACGGRAWLEEGGCIPPACAPVDDDDGERGGGTKRPKGDTDGGESGQAAAPLASRGPQSSQSVQGVHTGNSAPAPPSSHSPSDAKKHELEQPALAGGMGGEGGAARGLAVGGGGERKGERPACPPG